jgi:hypothetical protein
VAYTWSVPPGQLAEAAYHVCEASVQAARAGEAAAALAAPYVAAVLFDSAVYGAARARLTLPDHAAGWEALARMTHEPVRSRCLELAQASRAA